MTEATGIGKNVEKAIEDALVQLKTARDNVDIKILETGGVFKKAKVLVTISEEYLGEYKQKQEKRKELEVEESKPEVKKESIKEEKQEPKPEVKKEAKTPVKAKEEEKQDKDEKYDENEAQRGKEFLEGFLKLTEVEGVVDVFEDETEIFYTIMGEKVSTLIGYRGESLNSLQFLVSVINGRHNRKSKFVRLDIDNYREKRKDTLEMLARRVAKKVLKTGHQTRLEPMTAYERRIIHTTIQEFEGLSSISRGEEPHRYLIIKKTDNVQTPENKEEIE